MSGHINSEKLFKNMKNYKKEEIESNLDIFFYQPNRLARFVRYFRKQKWKSLKMLKAAIHLQKVRNGKYSWQACLYIDENFGLSHNSLLKGNIEQSKEQKTEISPYNMENVRNGIENCRFNEDCKIFCTNLKNLHNQGYKTNNIAFLTDIKTILDIYAKENNFPMKIYKNHKIYDQRLLFLLLKEEKFSLKTKFLLSFHYPDIFKSENKLQSLFQKMRNQIKKSFAAGFKFQTSAIKTCTVHKETDEQAVSVSEDYFKPDGNVERIDDTDEANNLIF